MTQLLKVRSIVLGLLEHARGKRCVVSDVLYFARLKVNVRQLSSSTEAEVDIILPCIGNDLTSLIMREGTFLRICWSTCTHRLCFLESFLKALFIVSNVSIIRDVNAGTSAEPWLYVDSVRLPGEIAVPPSPHRFKGHCSGTDEHIGVRVRPATLAKCPRCWTYTRPHRDDLCPRCTGVLSTLS
jgi:isoleucyl-tRNA synthetase